MKYTVRKSVIWVLGYIWVPNNVLCGQRIELRGYDLANIGDPTRENVEAWLATNAGNFSQIVDFEASLEVDGMTVDIPWQSDENAMLYADCLSGEE